jgi:S1-C subfamily serine protease
MPIELRILTGSRGGHHERFEKRVVTLGRHLQSDLRFDPNADLDVSARHAEIVRDASGAYRIRDVASTNGTFLNGRRIVGSEPLASGDVIWLGAEGPHVEVRIAGAPTPVDEEAIPATAVRSSGQRPTTGERVKAAVRAETAWMRRVLVVSLVVLAGGIGAAYWTGHRGSRPPIVDVPDDVQAISQRNDPAIAFLATELDGKPYGGTAFGIAASGMLITSRHNVQSPVTGQPATRLGIKYANTDVLLHAHVVRVASEPDVDLALVQVDDSGSYPVVAGIARSLGNVRVGSPVVTIGFPHALDTPMEGSRVKTSLTAGTVSKLLPGLLQVDAYASHGSSGSPVFDGHGWVIGVVYGGDGESSGRITYAVASERLVGMVPAGLLRP